MTDHVHVDEMDEEGRPEAVIPYLAAAFLGFILTVICVASVWPQIMGG